MKRIPVMIFILLSVLAVGCDDPVQAPEGRLLLETNVKSIRKDDSTGASATRTVYEEGGPIIGVLLQTNTGSKDTFKLEYLGDDVDENGDGMPFNYILYQPEAIPDAYMEAGGNVIVATETGAPFWWYMMAYLGISEDEAYRDWYRALSALLTNQEELPYPRAEDCKHPQTTPPARLDVFPEDLEIPEIADGEIIFLSNYEGTDIPAIEGLRNLSQWDGPFARKDRNEYGKVIRQAFYLSENLHLYVPTILDEVYGVGKDGPGSNSLWNYMNACFPDVDTSGAREDFSIVIKALLEASTSKDGLPWPSDSALSR